MSTIEFKVSRYERMTAEEADESPLLSFSGREEYLAWVAAWKAALKERVESIRAEKARRRDTSLEVHERNGANNERQALRVEACNLVALRLAGKRRSSAARAARLAAA